MKRYVWIAGAVVVILGGVVAVAVGVAIARRIERQQRLEAARQAAAQNLRGIAQAMAVYADDSNDPYPVVNRTAWPGAQSTSLPGNTVPATTPLER